jgi:hypothetical protein
LACGIFATPGAYQACAKPGAPMRRKFVQFRHTCFAGDAKHRSIPFNRDDYRPAPLFLMRTRATSETRTPLQSDRDCGFSALGRGGCALYG